MKRRGLTRTTVAVAILLCGAGTTVPGQSAGRTCKRVHADLLEQRTTTNCRPGHPVCFLGEVDGNHGLRGTTYFRPESATPPIPTAPAFVGYGGTFEYTIGGGAIVARESGVTSTAVGVVTAYQQIIAGTGDFAGVTGHFFVSGSNNGQEVVTRVTGEICYP